MWFDRLRELFFRLRDSCRFLDGKGCACGGAGLIHELEVEKRARLKAEQEARPQESSAQDAEQGPED